MPSKQHSFLNFQVDHMAMHALPAMYDVAYLIYRIIFGVEKEDVLYDKNVQWVKEDLERSMTYAVRIGKGAIGGEELQNTVIAMIQPTEPTNFPSHVRKNLKDHNAAAHWMHIALRTPDLLAFHKYALDRGVNFITPIMTDDDEDLIQVFSGEWFIPGGPPSGTFFEFVQRNVNEELKEKIEKQNRETWFRDKTFLGLYEEKEREYQSGNIAPFIDDELFSEIHNLIKHKPFRKITEDDIRLCEEKMLNYAKKKISA